MNTEQERADFEAWYREKYNSTLYCEARFEGWQAGRAALQSQPKAEPSEWLKQHEALMHRVSKAATVVGYSGTINWATAEQTLENAETALLDHARALQSQDREDAERYRLLRRGQKWSVIDGIGNELRAEGLDAAIDHARRAEGADDA